MSVCELGDERLPERFWAKVSVNVLTGCWEWTSTRHVEGYGHFRWCSAMRLAHRVSYEALRGAIDGGLKLDHLCRNRACVNPDHLEPVTDRMNILRGNAPSARNAVKTHCVHGHEFTEKNTYVTKRWIYGKEASARVCRACARIASAAARRKARMAPAGVVVPETPQP